MPSNPKKVDLSEIDRIIFTSPSTIDNFVKLYGYLPTDKELKTRGVVTEKHLMEILNKKHIK
jgi:uroporphyrinogen-III synthase